MLKVCSFASLFLACLFSKKHTAGKEENSNGLITRLKFWSHGGQYPDAETDMPALTHQPLLAKPSCPFVKRTPTFGLLVDEREDKLP
jgi:hypothetical protein